MVSPDTVSEAVVFLVERGYRQDLELAGVDLDEVVVEHTFRFEGPSDPADEAIVLGLLTPDGRRGVVVSAYGPDADREETLLLAGLAGRDEL